MGDYILEYNEDVVFMEEGYDEYLIGICAVCYEEDAAYNFNDIVREKLGLELDSIINQSSITLSIQKILEEYPDISFIKFITNEEKNHISNYNTEMLVMDEYDESFIGIRYKHGCPIIAVYDRDMCIEQLIDRMEGTDKEKENDAIEYFNFNTTCAYSGEYTPAILTRFDNDNSY